MLNKVKQRNEGFTIIEVMIVLAIAGLIMLVVFLAVPALQRNSRNTQRKNDVSSLVGAMSEYVNNNNGKLPPSCTAGNCNANTPTTQWLSNAQLALYDKAKISLTNRTSATAPTAVSDADVINIYNYLKCNGNNPSTTGATNRSVAALYAVETTGAPQSQCIEM